MIDSGLVMTLLVLVVGLLVGLGCESEGFKYPYTAFLVLRYDPDLVVAGAKVVIERVEFTIDGLGETHVAQLDSDGSFVFDGMPVPESLGAHYADPVGGQYWFWGVVFPHDPNGRVNASCEAFARRSDGAPTYPYLHAPIERVPIDDMHFQFRLVQENARWVIAPA